jgi:hypothetical protein
MPEPETNLILARNLYPHEPSIPVWNGVHRFETRSDTVASTIGDTGKPFEAKESEAINHHLR